MRNFLKLAVLILLILAMAFGSVLGVSAQNVSAPVRYDAFREGIVSSYYHIDAEKGYIIGVAPGTTAERLLNVCLPATAVASQETLATGTVITATCTAPAEPETPPSDTTEPPVDTTVPPSDTTEPPTDMTVPPADAAEPSTDVTAPPTDAAAPASEYDAAPAAETKTYSLTVIVTGDLNGDAHVSITDMLMLKSAVLGEPLSDTAAAAGDINYDGKITITDFLMVKSALLGLDTISAGRPAGTSPSDPIILMTPNSTESWSPQGAASFASDDNTVAVIDKNGTITSQAREGSTFVYALDGNGTVLARAMVTVLNEKLTVSLDASAHRLIMGQALTLIPRFNHPVSPTVTWASSDPSVVTVDENGTLTTQHFGTAVVTASIPNGSKAETTITVAPPITAITFDKTLYKIKPGSSRTLGISLTPADTGEEILWSSSNTSIATVSSDGTVTGVAYGTATITAKGKYSGLSASCSVKICDVKQVAITFDDGPSTYTSELLDFLKKNDIKATFFMVGNRLSMFPETVKKMVAGGHEIGYHSYAHTFQSYLSSSQITSDFNASSKILKELTGAAFTVWRAPGGDYNSRVLQCIPLPHIGWSVDTRDWETLNANSVYYAVRSAKDGAIILLHDLYSSSVNGAIKAMQEMNAGDYEFLTVTELLSRDGTAPEKSTHYYIG